MLIFDTIYWILFIVLCAFSLVGLFFVLVILAYLAVQYTRCGRYVYSKYVQWTIKQAVAKVDRDWKD